MAEESWRKPITQFVHYMRDSERLTRLTYRGIDGVQRLHNIAEVLKPEEDLGRAAEEAKLAATEITSDFPLLHAHVIMGEWGALECLIEDLVEEWVRFKPDILNNSTFSRVKVPFSEFLSMSDDDRLKFLISEVQRDLKLDLKSGATKFEKLLDVIGLGGPVDSRVRDALFEAQNIRNVWAHRAGIADRRLVEACPQLNFKEGDRVTIGRESCERYHQALYAYVITIINRCHKAAGIDTIALELPHFKGLFSSPATISSTEHGAS